jgi:hypothetical protein
MNKNNLLYTQYGPLPISKSQGLCRPNFQFMDKQWRTMVKDEKSSWGKLLNFRESACKGHKSACRGSESACRAHKSAFRGSGSVCIARESTTRGLETVAEA